MLRLTLRTLLAYLDDTLSPSEAREIGQQIADEPSLNELIARIRDSMRKRRLVADSPDVDDAKLDPNEVAEYLDSVLPASRVIELEKRVLESDQDLAEVASVHQILSLVLVKPADLTDAAKEKAYRVIKSRARSHTELAPVGPARAQFASSARVRDESPVPLGMSDMEPVGAKTRVFTGVAVAVLLLILMSLVFVTLVGVDGVKGMLAGSSPDASLARGDAPVKSPNDIAAKPPESPAPVSPATDAAAPPADENDTKTETTLPVDPLDDIKEIEPSDTPPADSPPTAPSPPEEEASPDVVNEPALPETPPSETSAEEPLDPSEPVEVAEAKPEDPTEPAEPSSPTEPLPPAELVDRSVPIAAYTSPTGILLRRSDAGWSRIKSQEFLFNGDVIAHAEPGLAKIRLDNGIILTLFDEAVMELSQGKDRPRLLLTGSAELGLEKKASVELAQAGSSATTLDFMDDASLILVSVDLVGWPTADAPSQPSRWRIRLNCKEGSVQVSRGDEKTTVRSGQGIDILSDEKIASTTTTGEGTESPARTVDASTERAVKKLSDLVSYGPRPQQTFRELMENSNRDLRILSIRSLEALGQYDALAGALRHPRFSEVREETFQSLRRCMRRGSPGRESAERAIRDIYSDRDEVDLIELVLGYSESAASQKATYARLIELLDADELAVREGAIQNVREWTGRDLGFSATGQSTQRKNAILKWQKWLETQGDTITPRREPEPSESESP